MENTQTGKEGLIEKLLAMQFAETAKPADRMDADLVDLLTDMLLDLDGISPIGQADHDAGIRGILDRISTPPTKANHKRTLRRLLIAAIIATLIFAAGLVYITLGSQGNPDQFKWAHYIVEHLLPGRSINALDDVTIYNNGTSKKYSSVAECLVKEGLDVLYPTVFPDRGKMKGVRVYSYPIPGDTRISFITEDNRSNSVSIDLESGISEEIISNCSSIVMIGDYKCYIASEGDWYQCCFTYNNNLYTVDAKSYDDLELIITNLKGSF